MIKAEYKDKDLIVNILASSFDDNKSVNYAGVNPFLPGVVGNGTENPAVPFEGLTENFSSIDFIAPPPLGRLIVGLFDFE